MRGTNAVLLIVLGLVILYLAVKDPGFRCVRGAFACLRGAAAGP